MNTDLHKRLEEAADEEYPISYIYNDLAMEYEDVNREARIAFIEGEKLGYKEAIKMAKEYLEKYISNYTSEYIVGCSKGEFISAFETDMNKRLTLLQLP